VILSACGKRRSGRHKGPSACHKNIVGHGGGQELLAGKASG
jgi:hypothetical protein